MTHAYLGLGSNLGDRKQYLRRAIHALERHAQIRVREFSSVYETEPWGVEDQPDYLNIVAAIATDLSPLALLSLAKDIEHELGRERTIRWGPRIIDIDILTYGDTVADLWDEESGRELSIPHPSMEERAFVLGPLVEIAPSFVHPKHKTPIQELLDDLGDEASMRRLPLPLEWGWRTYVMGIVNMTPDSFSGDGLLNRDTWVEETVAQGRQFVEDGADILDVGGESTRPGSTPVSAEEERERVVPAIRALRAAVSVPISVDTYRASVASAALDAGADWVNDVWGLRMDPKMAPLLADAGCPTVLMHNRSRPKDVRQGERLGGRYVGIEYEDLLEDIRRELLESVELARNAGMHRENIILDPGIGFGKTVSQNLRLIDELHQIKALGFPLLLGSSRKSFIGYTLDLPPEERVEGTAATVAIGIDRGADIVRVHDVRLLSRVARMTDHIVRRGDRGS